jgi:putative membrane protein
MNPSRLFVPLALAVAMCGFTGCGVRNVRTDSVRIANDLNHDRFAGQPVEMDAAAFLVEAADGSRMEVDTGRAALEHSENTDVRDFAQRMVNDHQQALDKIGQIAAAQNVELPSALSNKNAKMLTKLEKKDGRGFDRKYINMMVADHEHAVAAFRRAAQSDDPAVRSFAQDTLPTLEEHLARIREINRTH